MKNANNFLGCQLIFLIFLYVSTYLQLFSEMGPVTLIILLCTGTVNPVALFGPITEQSNFWTIGFSMVAHGAG